MQVKAIKEGLIFFNFIFLLYLEKLKSVILQRAKRAVSLEFSLG